MLFNSLEFALFLPVVFILYWFVTRQNLKLQNFLLLAAGYFFYGWWDWRFLFLLVALSLGFFPILLAGPIQRPSTLLPQITRKREFNYSQAVDGLRQILWGLFAKIVIADKLAPLVDDQ